MSTIGVTELGGDIDSVLQRVADEGETIQIVKDGEVVAQLVPVERLLGTSFAMGTKDAIAEHEAVWAELDRIGERLSESWPAGLTAVDAIREERRG